MNANTANGQTAVIIIAFVCFVGLTLYYYRQGDQLFKLLASRHPKYYKKNQEPLSFGDPLSNAWAGFYLMLLIFRGIPKDFPDDLKARNLAKKSRKIGVVLLGYLGVVLAIVFASMILT